VAKIVEKTQSIFNIFTTSTGALIGFLFGNWGTPLKILLTLVILDYLSGLIASGIEGKLSSRIGFKGIFKKIMIFVIIAVAHLIDIAIGEGSMVMTAAIFFYMANEILSIVENAGRSGLFVPGFIKQAVEILKGRGENGKDI